MENTQNNSGKANMPNLNATQNQASQPFTNELQGNNAAPSGKGQERLNTVYDVPVKVSAILGRSKIKIKDLVALEEGAVIELDRKVGEAIDIFVNDRLVARGEVVMVEDRLGVTMTELFTAEK